jgi:hypothetical protein
MSDNITLLNSTNATVNDILTTNVLPIQYRISQYCVTVKNDMLDFYTGAITPIESKVV